jgi:hypothetical protein
MIKNENEIGIDPFKVYVRVRPLNERELAEAERHANKSIITVENNLVKITI